MHVSNRRLPLAASGPQRRAGPRRALHFCSLLFPAGPAPPKNVQLFRVHPSSFPPPVPHTRSDPNLSGPVRAKSPESMPGLGGERTLLSVLLFRVPARAAMLNTGSPMHLPTFPLSHLPAGMAESSPAGRSAPVPARAVLLLRFCLNLGGGCGKFFFARAHGMWTYEPRQGRKAATVVCSAPAVVTLALFFTRSRAGTGPREPSAGRGLPRARRGGKSLRSCLIKS